MLNGSRVRLFWDCGSSGRCCENLRCCRAYSTRTVAGIASISLGCLVMVGALILAVYCLMEGKRREALARRFSAISFNIFSEESEKIIPRRQQKSYSVI